MVRYLQAGASTVCLPKEMVFIDKSGRPHLIPSLTAKHHITASHYGKSAVEIAYNSKPCNLLKIKKGTLSFYTEKVKKQKKSSKRMSKSKCSSLNCC
jgi:hypothetical protein